MNTPGIWLVVRTYILRETCDEDARDVTCPKPLTQITKSNIIVGVRDNDEPNTKKTKRNMKNTVWNIADKNINIACMYYLWLSVARVDILCSRNVMFFSSYLYHDTSNY